MPLNTTAVVGSTTQVKKVQSNLAKQSVVPSIQIKGALKQNMVTKTRSNARSHSLSDANGASAKQNSQGGDPTTEKH